MPSQVKSSQVKDGRDGRSFCQVSVVVVANYGKSHLCRRSVKCRLNATTDGDDDNDKET